MRYHFKTLEFKMEFNKTAQVPRVCTSDSYVFAATKTANGSDGFGIHRQRGVSSSEHRSEQLGQPVVRPRSLRHFGSGYRVRAG